MFGEDHINCTCDMCQGVEWSFPRSEGNLLQVVDFSAFGRSVRINRDEQIAQIFKNEN